MQKEREHSTWSLDIASRRMLDPAHGKPSRRPRSPSLNHNVKERRLRRN